MNNTTKRFDNAVTKLYNAFHNGELNAMKSCQCAIGNMVGGHYWNPYSQETQDEAGYNAREIINIEQIFMHGRIPNKIMQWYFNKTNFLNEGTGWSGYDVNNSNKELQFLALTKVIEYLCELDNIPNVMDYTSLFEFDKDLKPKKELTI